MKLSICIPVYNGALTIGTLVKELLSEFSDSNLEIVLVNDGSPNDDSESVCKALAHEYENVKFIGLRRNFGEHNATMCALAHCTGDYAVTMGDDSQNPPAEVRKLLEKAVEGYDAVYGQYRKKKHSAFRNFGSWVHNAVANWLLDKPKKLSLSSFRLISRPMVDEILKYTGPFPFIDGLILRATSSIASTEVEHLDRAAGKSNYTLRKLLNLWLRMFINFSQKPLRIASTVGMFLASLCVILAIVFAVQKIIDPTRSQGWASLIISILFMGSVQLIFLGLLGEYLGKAYLDINNTPQWTVKTTVE